MGPFRRSRRSPPETEGRSDGGQVSHHSQQFGRARTCRFCDGAANQRSRRHLHAVGDEGLQFWYSVSLCEQSQAGKRHAGERWFPPRCLASEVCPSTWCGHLLVESEEVERSAVCKGAGTWTHGTSKQPGGLNWHMAPPCLARVRFSQWVRVQMWGIAMR